MTEKLINNSQPVLQNRFRFCKISVLIALLLLFAAHFTHAQTWSEPSVIWAKPFNLDYPDFVFDNNGNIHCVWSAKLGTNYYRIYYSKSTNDGNSWSFPVNASMNNSMWMTQPHIVCDGDNHLHLTYDHNVGSIYNTHIIHRVHTGTNWSEADTVTKGDNPGATYNRLVIDNNDRLYCFWYKNSSARYRYRDKGSGAWSETIQPHSDSLTVFIQKVAVGEENTLHCLIYSNISGYYAFKQSYLKFSDGIWNPIENVGPLTTGNKSDLALDNQGHPHLVWQHTGLSSPGNDSTMYRFFDGTTWSETEFIVQHGDQMAVCIDHYNNKHIVVSQKSEAGYQLVHYRNLNGSWVGEIMDEDKYTFYRPKLMHRGSQLYLVHCMADTVIGPNAHTRIVMRKYDIATRGSDNKMPAVNEISIFPNPFQHRTNIHFEILKKARVNVLVYNIKGELQTTLFSSEREPGKIELNWDGTDSNVKRVPPGIYIIKIMDGNYIFSKTVGLI